MQLLEQKLLESWPFDLWSQTRILIAVSGGADSVALYRALRSVATRPELLHVAHFNHQWRGAESDAEERFVRELCDSGSVDCAVGRATELTAEPVARTEQAARTARYEFLTAAAYRVGARYIVTAHTASDRVETLLHNLCRGTGIAGAATPQRVRSIGEELVLVRPLLKCFRAEVVDYLSQLGQAYCDDSSNSNEAYKRNFLRQRVLPELRETYGEHVDQHLLSFSELAEEFDGALKFYALRWLEQALEHNGELRNEHCGEQGDSVILLRSAMTAEPWPVVQLGLVELWVRNRWPLGAMSRQHWEQIRAIACVPDDSLVWRVRLNLPNNLLLSTQHERVKIGHCTQPET